MSRRRQTAEGRRQTMPPAVLLLGIAFAAGGQTPGASDAMALLAKSAAAFSSAASDASAFTQIYTPTGFSTSRRESGTVRVQAPDLLRFDYSAPEVKVFTYDGGEGRFYSPADKQLTVHKLSPDEKAKLPIVFLEKPDELARRYEISRGADGAVVLKPRAPDSELAWLRLAIGESGMVENLAYEDTSGNRTEFRFEGWTTERARPLSDYRIEAPRGTRVVRN